ncbi:hypothetical protein [Streptomyces sp. NPDC053431]|uniref:hypothetical protein n=1 Tax=Streptomyces sp. NPDC053431 TaxID=3365703 RepID=UPI0037D3A921
MDVPTTYEQKHLLAIAEVKGCARLRVLAEERGAISAAVENAADAFARIERRKGIRLDPELQRCFLRYSDLGLYWRGDGPYGDIAGEFYLPRLTKALLGGPSESIAATNPEEAELYAQLRVIDYHPHGGTGTFSALRVATEGTSSEIWYYDMNRGIFPLDIDYCTYLDQVLVTRGFYGWQYLFADVSFRAREFAAIAVTARKSIDLLSALFPDAAYEPLESRLAQRLNR